MKVARIIGGLILVLISGAVLAQGVPQLINYQGRLTDDTGLPIDGAVEMRFRLLDADTITASVLWSETQSSVQVKGGIYHIMLGSVNPLPPSALSQADIYLEVRVAGEILRPRSRITSVAFAHKADQASQAAQVAPGAVTAESIGENCEIGEALIMTSGGWSCGSPWHNLWWAWMNGSNAINQYGVYGTKGTPDPVNVPGGRRWSVSWIDSSGDMWLFGGFGYDASGGRSLLNDLWRWDGTNWTWMSGSDVINQYGVYGTKGTPDPANVPGARYGSVSWIDSSDNMWLSGGAGYPESAGIGYLNDLWRWDGTNWAWISGSNVLNQNGVYGTKGTPDPANVPGSREIAVSWIDSSNNMWLFGGYGYPASGEIDYLNDLWRWDGSNWTWMSGSDVINQNGVYGTKGTPDSANYPGSRRYAVSWTDISGNLWLFGGFGFAESGFGGDLNDLWRWDGGNWTWMSGSDVINQYGFYGIKGTPGPANVPGARGGSVSWTDSSGNIWLFGGFGNDSSGKGDLNDLWRFY